MKKCFPSSSFIFLLGRALGSPSVFGENERALLVAPAGVVDRIGVDSGKHCRFVPEHVQPVTVVLFHPVPEVEIGERKAQRAELVPERGGGAVMDVARVDARSRIFRRGFGCGS